MDIGALQPAAARAQLNWLAERDAELARQLDELVESLRRQAELTLSADYRARRDAILAALAGIDSRPTPAGSPYPIEVTGQPALADETPSTRPGSPRRITNARSA